MGKEAQERENVEAEIERILSALHRPPYSNWEKGFEIYRRHGLDPEIRGGGSKEKGMPPRVILLTNIKLDPQTVSEVEQATKLLEENGLIVYTDFVEGHLCDLRIGHYIYRGLTKIRQAVDPQFNPLKDGIFETFFYTIP